MSLGKVLLAAMTCAVFSVMGAGGAAAAEYPFCRSGEGGYGDCRYDSLAQCQAAIAGTAGYCQPNYRLPAPDQNRPAQQRARRS